MLRNDRQIDYCPCSYIDSCDVVSEASKTALNTTESISCRPISLIHCTTARASLRCMSWVNSYDRNPSNRSFVLDELTQLIEAPRVMAATLSRHLNILSCKYLLSCRKNMIKQKRRLGILHIEKNIERNYVYETESIIENTKKNEQNQRKDVGSIIQNIQREIESILAKGVPCLEGNFLMLWGADVLDVVMTIGEGCRLTTSMGVVMQNERNSSLLKLIIKTSKNTAHKNIRYFVQTVIKLNVMSRKRVVLQVSNRKLENKHNVPIHPTTEDGGFPWRKVVKLLL